MSPDMRPAEKHKYFFNKSTQEHEDRALSNLH